MSSKNEKKIWTMNTNNMVTQTTYNDTTSWYDSVDR